MSTEYQKELAKRAHILNDPRWVDNVDKESQIACAVQAALAVLRNLDAQFEESDCQLYEWSGTATHPKHQYSFVLKLLPPEGKKDKASAAWRSAYTLIGGDFAEACERISRLFEKDAAFGECHSVLAAPKAPAGKSPIFLLMNPSDAVRQQAHQVAMASERIQQKLEAIAQNTTLNPSVPIVRLRSNRHSRQCKEWLERVLSHNPRLVDEN